MSKHTPGPWETHFAHDVTGYPAFYIHGMSGDQKRDEPTLQANAKLIAAAPELLQSLEGLLNALPSATTHPAIAAARAAISKATGAA